MYQKEFDSWNKIKKETNTHESPHFKEGQIRWSRFGVNVGTEQDGKGKFFKRPVLIIKKFSNTSALVAPLTTNLKKVGSYFYLLETLGEKRIILLTQIKYFDSRRFGEIITKISESKLKDIRNKLKEII